MPAEIMAENTATNGDSRKQYGQYLPILLTRSFRHSLLLRPLYTSVTHTHPCLESP
jgi:methyltransferase-like protein